MVIKNKKASYEFFLLEEYTAGIILQGTEIKSIRKGKASINNSYCAFKNNELFLIDSHIAEYDFGNINNHEPKRDRKLLLTKRELKKIKKKISEKGFTIVPTKMFIDNRGLCKIQIYIAKGKKLYDHRESLKEKDFKREKKHF